MKYVFVIFNENHSFDNEFGTFPGVNGIYSDGLNPRSPANTPGFTQTYQDVNGHSVTVQPFLLGPKQNATFRDSVDHSHTGLATKINVVNGVAQMNQFSLDEYNKYAKAGNIASQKEGTEFARRGDVAHRLQHHPVLLAVRQPLRDLRQHLRHRGYAVDAERDRHARRPVRRDPVGEASEHRRKSDRYRNHRPLQRHGFQLRQQRLGHEHHLFGDRPDPGTALVE